MGTQLIMTVGTNPLPVWVAWYHLKEKLPEPVSVQLVYTPDTANATGTETQKDLLKSYFKGSTCILNSIPVSVNNPDRIDICNRIIDQLPPGCTEIHVHYTGGTQAMGVATVSGMLLAKATLQKEGQDINIDASYLDPGRGSAPNIVSWVHNPLIKDTRKSIQPNIHTVAELNGFKAGGFRSSHYTPYPRCCPLPRKPTREELDAGIAVLEHIQQFDYKYRDNKGRIQRRNAFSQDLADKWKKTFGQDSHFVYPNTAGQFEIPSTTNNNTWHQDILPKLKNAYPNCTWNSGGNILCYPDCASATSDQKRDLEEMGRFLCGIWLEYAVYAAFKEVLEEIDQTPTQQDPTDDSRSNYDLFHNVYVRKNTKGANPHFELDVVVVLGYQVIVVSCGVTANRKEIKLKAMEAYHRAKQLGGDEARAIMLCVATNRVVEGIQKELEDETGTKHPLRVWGKSQSGNIPNMASLRDKLQNLLKDLYWD